MQTRRSAARRGQRSTPTRICPPLKPCFQMAGAPRAVVTCCAASSCRPGRWRTSTCPSSSSDRSPQSCKCRAGKAPLSLSSPAATVSAACFSLSRCGGAQKSAVGAREELVEANGWCLEPQTVLHSRLPVCPVRLAEHLVFLDAQREVTCVVPLHNVPQRHARCHNAAHGVFLSTRSAGQHIRPVRAPHPKRLLATLRRSLRIPGVQWLAPCAGEDAWACPDMHRGVLLRDHKGDVTREKYHREKSQGRSITPCA